MSCKNKFVRTEMISLKKPTALDKVAEKVQKPKGAIPNFGLPKWKAIPLESKIPMVPGPEGAYNFSRQKLGKKLWIGSPDAEFNTSDPCNYEMEFQYEEFHDEYLKDFFRRPINIQRMMKLGLVTKNLDAKCSLKDYNMYRKYLTKLHSDSVKKELNKKAERCIEMKDIKFAEDKAKKDLERLKKREHAEIFKKEEENRKKIRENRLKSKIRKYKDKLKEMELKRREDHRNRIVKRKEKIEKIRQIREMAAKLERRKLIRILTNRKRKENERMKMRKKRLIKEEEERNKFIQDRWKMKEQLQFQELEREEFLKRCIDQERQMFIQEYNKKIEKERRRMQKSLEKSRKFVKCYMARHISRCGKRACCKIPESNQEKSEQLDSKTKDSETTGKKIPKVRMQNNREKDDGKKKQEKKSKTYDLKIKKRVPEEKLKEQEQTLSPETNEILESDEELESIVSCSQIIPQDDAKSKCECEESKFFQRYEISK